MSQATAVETSVLTPEEQSGFRAAFDLFDKDGDGLITAEEVWAVFQSIGHHVSLKVLRDAFREADLDGDGSIDFQEFIAMNSETIPGNVDIHQELREVFKFFDKDGDGVITEAELGETMRSLDDQVTERDIHQMIRVADLGGSGVVNVEDFIKLMTNK